MPSKRKPTVLQIVPALEVGGVERGTVEIALAAKKQGFTSLVASSGGKLVEQLDKAGVEHITLPLASKNPVVVTMNAQRLAALIEERGVDVLHARSRAPAWSGYVAAKRTGCHFLTTFHGMYGRGSAAKRGYNGVMVKGERVIAISRFVQQHIKKEYGIPASRVDVIHRGVDVAAFDPKKISKERLKAIEAEWMPQKYLPVVLMPARFSRWKGHDFLLRSLSLIPHHDYTCILMGSEKGHARYVKELKELAARLQLRGNVSFQASTEDMPAAYRCADLVVAPSLEPEAFGRVATEAQAMGTQVIATKHGGAKETVLDGKTGWLVKPGDEKALSKRIMEALVMRENDKAKMAKAARAHVTKNFSLKQMCDKTLAVYKKLVK